MTYAALQWYIDNGVDEALGDEPIDRFSLAQRTRELEDSRTRGSENSNPPILQSSNPPLLGASEAETQAVKLANAASTLEDLQKAIADFKGIEIKKTATNLVFADGNPQAKVMIIGEAPGADEDRQGKPFVGESGQLLDRIFKCINLSRSAENPEEAIYITNILNWRPPGNRTPTTAEITVSLPFIERHIALAKPDFIVLAGGVAAKSLLGRSEGISRLRKDQHTYQTLTSGLTEKVEGIPTIATYHPSYLLTTPLQKKAVWADMLTLQAMLQKTGQSA